MKKANYDTKPSAIQAVGNGSYLYRWEMEECTTASMEEAEPHTSWNCYEVTVWNTPTENSITEAVINALWGGGVEQKLLNDYYASREGVLDEALQQPYRDFLAARKAVKEQIATDYGAWRNLFAERTK